jgi:hypothetical protein
VALVVEAPAVVAHAQQAPVRQDKEIRVALVLTQRHQLLLMVAEVVVELVL